MTNLNTYHEFKVCDSDGKTYKCIRKIDATHDEFTQIISVLGVRSTVDPYLYGKTGHPVELMEYAANALALEIVHNFI
ncbi:MAG: hypothetical protein EBR59_02825 [Methylococcaceae bacterium]|nr:hypothetical protein [Methylococcaceae bacterium]